MLKIEKKNSEMIEVYGKQFEIQLPTVKQVFEFQEKSKAEGFNDFKESVELLCMLGVPKEIIDELSSDDFKVLIEYIFTPKKK